MRRHPVLPSQVHPSYPYGNPTNIKHPAAKPRPTYDPFSRALFEDMGYAGGGVNGALRWRDLALDELMPFDEEKEEVKKAMLARKMASGTTNQNPQQGQQQQQQQRAPPQPPGPPDLTVDEEDGENDENDLDDDEDIDDEEDLSDGEEA
ncbi:hypothetical protein AX17_006951 [Amanita inopinata Kibby_2008]|nr:hypothetical protein AX17_006951 [Amanita inopinata Kibby_2008]